MNSENYETFLRMGVEESHMKLLYGSVDYNKLFEQAHKKVDKRLSCLKEIYRIKLNSIPDESLVYALIEDKFGLKVMKVKAEVIKSNRLNLIHFSGSVPRLSVL